MDIDIRPCTLKADSFRGGEPRLSLMSKAEAVPGGDSKLSNVVRRQMKTAASLEGWRPAVKRRSFCFLNDLGQLLCA